MQAGSPWGLHEAQKVGDLLVTLQAFQMDTGESSRIHWELGENVTIVNNGNIVYNGNIAK